ncbi:aminoacyl-tRNA deacylase [Niallia sp. 03133]|uniref:aminoacyl-tRNA deacylase n=1 Tax=Niallia sp. 03133 TaxID=3458060 RepID=UPI004043ECB9
MENLLSILSKNSYRYEIIHHQKPIHSAQEGSNILGIAIAQTAPSLILKTDIGFVYLIASGTRKKISFENIAELLNCRKVKLASSSEVKKITGFNVGSVPIIGVDLPCIIDKKLFPYDFIYGGTGKSTSTLKIEPQALKEMNNVIAVYD